MKIAYSESDFRNFDNLLSLPAASVSSAIFVFIMQRFAKAEFNNTTIGLICFFGFAPLCAAAAVNFVQHKRKVPFGFFYRAVLTWALSVLFCISPMFIIGIIAMPLSLGTFSLASANIFLVLLFGLVFTFPVFLIGIGLYFLLKRILKNPIKSHIHD